MNNTVSPRLVFFDVDGTLSAPSFHDGSRLVIGFPEESWHDCCALRGENSYDLCKPVLPVKRYAARRKEEGALLYVLTTCSEDVEVPGKQRFIQRCYPGLFEELLHVKSDKEKLTAMEETARRHGLTLADCELVEDTYATLLYVMGFGVTPTHLSLLVSDL